jgi:hypothetical protein
MQKAALSQRKIFLAEKPRLLDVIEPATKPTFGFSMT